MFNTLVISGASSKGLLFVGALHYIHLKHNLASITSYYGTSAGAIICLLLAIGYEPLELAVCFKRTNINFDLSLSKNDAQLFDFDAIVDCLRTFCAAKIGQDEPPLTLQTVYDQFGRDLYFVTYNYTRGKMELLSRHTHPAMDAVEAIRLSAAIPLLFKRCIYEGAVYVDGGIVNNFPLDIAVKHKRTHILALNCDENLERGTDVGVLPMISHLLAVPITLKARETEQKYRRRKDCLIINVKSDVAVYNLRLSDADIFSMLSAGYCAARSRLVK